MMKVGVIGLGMMGQTHLDAYSRRSDVKVVAVSDKDPRRLTGEAIAKGNVAGQAQGSFDLSKARGFAEGMDLIHDAEVQLVDICLATPLHVEYALAALAAGKHVLIEKPLARTAADAERLVKAAEGAKGFAMCAMCMRFWPGWTWLKEAVDSKIYGRLNSARFARLATMPGGGFYANGALSGGAILDLHLHDTDFVQFLFGKPAGVSSFGYTKHSGAIDHVLTHYLYEGADAPAIVTAEGAWAMTPPYEFRMQYTVAFEKATAVYDSGSSDPLVVYDGEQKRVVELEKAMGYDLEIGYFLECITRGRRPQVVTLHDAAEAIRIVEAEVESIARGGLVRL